MSLKQISMNQLFEITSNLASTDVVLDVRTPGEFAAGHIKGSVNIPHDQVLAHINQLKKYNVIYIHCRSGARAAAAASTLTSNGLTNLVCISGSGMEDWVGAGYPVERKQ